MKAFIFDAEGRDREVALDAAALRDLGDNCLLWAEVTSRGRATVDEIARLFALDPGSADDLLADELSPRLDNYGAYFQVALTTAPGHERPQDSKRLDVLVGDRWVVTVHEGPLDYFEHYRAQDKAETMIGALTPQGLAASLMDWHLGTFFGSIAQVEAAVDRLDDHVLRESGRRSTLARMVTLRRQVSQLRARLSAQRPAFYALGRPDFTFISEGPAAAHFASLPQRFERAIDEVERARDLVVGSFELMNSRISLQTNQLVRALTLVTVVIGFGSFVAGVFGMNFDAPIFETGERGLYTVLASLAAFAAAALFAGRWARWF